MMTVTDKKGRKTRRNRPARAGRRGAAVLALLGWSAFLGAFHAAGAETDMSGVFSPGRAQTNYAMNCQGCHRATAEGLAGSVPAMRNFVARFLSVDGGRDYLIRVPGMANAALSDEELAELANWVLGTFDPAHLPADFTPYTPEEVGRLRRQPFIADAAQRRARLVEAMARTAGGL